MHRVRVRIVAVWPCHRRRRVIFRAILDPHDNSTLASAEARCKETAVPCPVCGVAPEFVESYVDSRLVERVYFADFVATSAPDRFYG
jgi:hypothetical protein